MRLRHLALPAAAGLALFAIPFAPAAQAATTDCSAEGNSCTAIIQTSGAPESFTVPAGVTQLLVAAYGGSGGSGFPQQQPADVARAGAGAHAAVAARAANGATDGGDGGSLLAQVPVTPGETLTFVAGGKGADASQDATDAPGGYGGGGTSPSISDGSDGAGGGGSFLFRGASVLLAVGGGGGGGFVDGGNGGTGGAGAAGTDGGDATLGGKAATTSAPGAGGGGVDSSAGTGPAAGPATFGNGGVATQNSDDGGCSAGGGGGGYFGGGSGGCNRTAAGVYTDGGGGGGSGFVASGIETLGTGTNTGDGGFVIGYTSAATTTTLSSDVTTLAPGQEATINAAVDGPELTIAGDDASAAAEAAVTKVAAAQGVGFSGAVKPAKANAAAAVLPPGTVINPGTACGATPCTVTFFVNGTQLADPISVDPATGVATIIFTAGSEEGVREITARYDGNLYYLQSTSDPLAITVSGLANTGPAHVAPLLVTSTLLLLAGAGLVAFGRRRPQLGSHRAA